MATSRKCRYARIGNRKFLQAFYFSAVYSRSTFYFCIPQILEAQVIAKSQWISRLPRLNDSFIIRSFILLRRNLETTESIQKKIGSLSFQNCSSFLPLAIMPGASIMEASFFGVLPREGRNCHRKSSVLSTQEKNTEMREGESTRKKERGTRIVLCSMLKGIRIFARWRNEIEMRRGLDSDGSLDGNPTESRNGWNIDTSDTGRGYIYPVPGLPVRALFFYDRPVPWIFYGSGIYISEYPASTRPDWAEITLARLNSRSSTSCYDHKCITRICIIASF